jgi:hypothetical protein
MIIAPRLQKINSLLGKGFVKSLVGRYMLMLLLGFVNHRGRMSSQQAAWAIADRPRHRANVGRFLKKHGRQLSWLATRASGQLLAAAAQCGTFVFVVDTTFVSHQGDRTENTFSAGNRQRRPAKHRRYQKQKCVRRRCHAFVCGLLLTPDGVRIPSLRCYYTPEYCRRHRLTPRTQADLAAELIRALAVPTRAHVIVLGDTGFESKQVRAACAARGFHWILPANPERVLAGAKPRPKLWSLAQEIGGRRFVPCRLSLNQGSWAAMRRLSPSRRGSKIQPRTFYVHEEKRDVRSLGVTRIVFSTKQRPTHDKPLQRDETKLLLSNVPDLTSGQIVELYTLRWQIELFFKELKSCLGLHQYRFRSFATVEAWVQACLITFTYLEWIRVQGLSRRKTAPQQRQQWLSRRTYGLALAVCQHLEEDQIRTFHQHTQTPYGIRKLRRLLRAALPKELQHAA